MITIHHLNQSRSHRILWLCEELRAKYKTIPYLRDKNTDLAPQDLKKIHPLGKAPIIEHDGKIITESATIIEYILDLHKDQSIRPERQDPLFTKYNYWMHSCEGSLMPLLLMKLIFTRMILNAPVIIRPICRMLVGRVNETYLKPSLDQILVFINDSLKEQDYIVSNTFTAADIMLGFALISAQSKLDVSTYHHIIAYNQRLTSREAYIRATIHGGDLHPIEK